MTLQPIATWSLCQGLCSGGSGGLLASGSAGPGCDLVGVGLSLQVENWTVL